MKSDPSAETPEQNGKFSLAAILANLFVTSKLTQLFILACLLLGLLALAFTPREDNPQIVVPGANIRVELPGASAEEIEQLVLRPLESSIKQIPAVDKVYGTAINSAALLSVQFEVGEDQEKALVKLHDRIDEARTRLPPAAGEPFIRGMNVDDVPIVTVTLASATYDDYALKRLADRLRDGLQSLRSVSATEVLGRARPGRCGLNWIRIACKLLASPWSKYGPCWRRPMSPCLLGLLCNSGKTVRYS